MINLEEEIWTWKDLIFTNFPDEIHRELKRILIDYAQRIYSYDFKDKTSISISFQSKISMTITLLKTYLKNDKCSSIDLSPLVEFTLFWSFITHIHHDHKSQFQTWWRQTFHHIPKEKSV